MNNRTLAVTAVAAAVVAGIQTSRAHFYYKQSRKNAAAAKLWMGLAVKTTTLLRPYIEKDIFDGIVHFNDL